MKTKQILNETDNGSVYRRVLRTYVSAKEGTCDRCRRGRGCNRRITNRSWKNYRKTQYKTL